MNQGELKERMKQFALAIIGFTESLPRTRTADVLGGQLLRSGASVGANYRSACRAKSVADFISKMGIVEEEVDESMYWMELLIGAKVVEATKIESLMKEAKELLAITPIESKIFIKSPLTPLCQRGEPMIIPLWKRGNEGDFKM
jgi:four helix bundle protein